METVLRGVVGVWAMAGLISACGPRAQPITDCVDEPSAEAARPRDDAPSQAGSQQGAEQSRCRPAEAKDACLPVAPYFHKIFNPSAGRFWPWYVNDHSVVRGPDQKWHLFGITHWEPLWPLRERIFVHADSPNLVNRNWQRRAPALEADVEGGETLLWAPHVIEHDGLYYMFYCAGADDYSAYQIKLATSRDLQSWTREPKPLFRDGFQARDPFVMRIEDRWVMYYTATSDPQGGNHIVAYRTSTDLRTWGERGVVYTDASKGTAAGNTESPFVVQRPEGYYLFIGPRNGYRSTEVFFSKDALSFSAPPIAELNAHAPEVIRGLDGVDYITHAGWGQGGVYLSRLDWRCPSNQPSATADGS